jgi:predicted membrane protein
MDMNQDWREQRQERREARRAGRGSNPWSGAFMGVLMIAAGLMFLLNNLDIIYFRNLFDFWPVLLIAFGAMQLMNSRGFGVWFVVWGGLLLAKNLGYISSIGQYFGPLAIIAVGVFLLMRNLYGPDWWGGPAAAGGSETQANRLYAETVFGGIDRKVVTQQFEGGKVAVIFGGGKIDLRSAGMKQPEVVLHADTVFGGIEILVPETWQADVRGSGVFGGYEDQTHKRSAADNAPRLIVKGGAVFGGVVVKN